MDRRLATIAVLTTGLGLAAFSCSASTGVFTGPPPTTAVADVSPAGGATGVATTSSITIRFSHPMMAGMEAYVSLHRDSLRGPAVSGTASWSADHMTLTFTPSAPLESHTTYVLHMGGGMRDANDAPISYASCPAFGGQTVTTGMMGSGGMMGGGGEMGPGWKGADGGYGMEFAFTTA